MFAFNFILENGFKMVLRPELRIAWCYLESVANRMIPCIDLLVCFWTEADNDHIYYLK
jgi:hypothetical protein